MAALVGLALIVAAAALAPVITPQNPYDLAEITILDSMLPPGGKNLEGKRYWLGTDDQGRDMLSGILYGLRTSVFVGIFSGIIAFFLGTTLGLMAAYFGGAIDSVIMRLVDLKLGFPSILVALLIVTVLGKGMDKIIIASSLSSGPIMRAPPAAPPSSSAARNTSRRRASWASATAARSFVTSCPTACRR